VFAIGADMNFDYLDGEQPRVGRFEADELGEFFADGFGDSECASFIHGKDYWPPMNADERRWQLAIYFSCQPLHGRFGEIRSEQ